MADSKGKVGALGPQRTLDIGRTFKSITLVYSLLEDCRANVEQFNCQCFEKSVKICELLDI